MNRKEAYALRNSVHDYELCAEYYGIDHAVTCCICGVTLHNDHGIHLPTGEDICRNERFCSRNADFPIENPRWRR